MATLLVRILGWPDVGRYAAVVEMFKQQATRRLVMSATTREMIRGWIAENKNYIASCHKQITELQRTIEYSEKKMEENIRAHDILEKAGIP